MPAKGRRDPGKRDRLIRLSRPDKHHATTTGEARTVYVAVESVWAEKKPVRGTEGFGQSQRFAEVTDRFNIRWRDDITPEWQVTYDAREYDITELLEIGRHEELDILAVARAE